MSTADILPSVLGIVLVAAAAAFALLPFARASVAGGIDSGGPEPTDRFALYRQVLELEFDMQLGKLTASDYAEVSQRLLAEAGQALKLERGSITEIDAEIEREIAAARAAFAAARGSVRHEPRDEGLAGEAPLEAEEEAARAPS